MPRLFRTSNVAMNARAFEGQQAAEGAPVMTLQGTVNKTAILLLIAFLGSAHTWGLAQSDTPQAVYSWILGGCLGGLLMAFATIYMKHMAWLTAPVYAALEGLALGGVSSLLELRYPGIAIHTVALTFGALAVTLILYSTRVVQLTEKFTLGVFIATGSITLIYFIDLGLRFFGMQVPLLNDGGPVGIVISLVITAIAALNLVFDFDLIETGVQSNSAEYMEWYGAFALLVTLVWLYMEMLRLLAKIRRR